MYIDRRSAGVCLPLFSIRSTPSWGIGEFPDIGRIAPWLAQAKLPVFMMLPLVEVALGQDSPYSAQSAFALDPIYIALEDVPEFRALGGDAALPPEDREALEALRARATIDYPEIRRLKEKWLRRCFEQWERTAVDDADRQRRIARFRDEHAAWLPDYLLFRALKEAHQRDWWRNWAPELRDREPAALEEARRTHAREIAFYEYIQWIAFDQLRDAREEAKRHGVVLVGDLPFMVAEDSADVWSRQGEFRFDSTIGVPPDAYSADGQDWGLPVYRWDVIARGGYDWLKLRGRRTAELFDMVRVDHVVGFYRTYARPKDGSENFFIPADEPSQIRQGEEVMRALQEGGVELIAEDLGTVPPFVRESLTRLGIPGFRVFRWEQDDGRFRDPAAWPERSLATTGTHDSEPLSTWWDALPPHERNAALQVPALRGLTEQEAANFNFRSHHALLEAVYSSGSNLLVLPIQDVFGARERINLPGTVSTDNWSYRLPWTIEALFTEPTPAGCARMTAELAKKHGRG